MNKKTIFAAILSLGVVACASNQAGSDSSNQPVASTGNPTDSTNAYGSGNGADVTTTNNNIGNAEQATNSVYFGVDQYSVDNQYDAVITQNANYLASHITAHVKVEGNTDDTGSVEYNLALGQRRADAVKRALVGKGANIKQIDAVSNGKLMAKFSNASDDGKAKNRRADIIYSGSQKPAGYTVNTDGLPVIK